MSDYLQGTNPTSLQKERILTDGAGALKVSFGSGTGAAQITGNVASGATDSGNPVKIGGVFNTTPPTLTTGQRGDAQMDARGNLRVALVNSGVSAGFYADNADGVAVTAGAQNLAVQARGTLYNGTSWDRARKSNVFNRVASSAASGNPAVGKGSAGDVIGWQGQNGAAVTFLQIYNKATAPVIGTDTPVLTIPIAANAIFQNPPLTMPLYLGTGIAYAFTTDAAGTTGAAAAAVTSFALFVA